MDFTEIKTITVKEQFIASVENAILSGELRVGEKLPSERELAAQMKISKTAVHSGIADMTRKGFLEVIPRKGVFVGDYAKNGTLEALTSIMHHSGKQLDPRTVNSVLEMRYAIESVAIERVVAIHDEAVICHLHTLLQAAEKEAEAVPVNAQSLAELYFTFHHYICTVSGNSIAPLILNAFKVPAVRFWANSVVSLGSAQSIQRLSVFVDMIEKGDAAGACAHLKEISYNCAQIVRG